MSNTDDEEERTMFYAPPRTQIAPDGEPSGAAKPATVIDHSSQRNAGEKPVQQTQTAATGSAPASARKVDPVVQGVRSQPGSETKSSLWLVALGALVIVGAVWVFLF